METWLIVTLVVLAVALLAVVFFVMPRLRRKTQDKKRTQARDHLHEAQVRSARAEKERATAEEQAARARRERAETEERAARAEEEARERYARAERERAEADSLQQRAQKLDPDVNKPDGRDGSNP